MRPRTVFLDWGGTLAQLPKEYAEPWTVWAGVLASERCPRAEGQIRTALETTDRELGGRIYAYLGKSSEYWKLYDEHVLDALNIRASRGEIENSVQRVFDDPSLVRLYPETPTVLATLRERGYRTGLISNHNDQLLRVLRHYALEAYLDTVTYSQEAGAEKPNPAVFTLALRRDDCQATDAVHVGDSLEADVEGARTVGIRPIWLNRQGLNHSPDCSIIRSLSELVPLLATLNEQERAR